MTAPAGSYSIDERLYLSFCKLGFRRSLPRSVAWSGLTIAIIVGVLSIFGFDVLSLLAGAAGGLAVLVVLLSVQWFVLLPWQARKVYRESASLREEAALQVDEDGFFITQESGTMRGRWGDMVKWDETSDLLAIYPNRLMATLLPKRELAGETIAYCHERLIASGLPVRGKLRK